MRGDVQPTSQKCQCQRHACLFAGEHGMVETRRNGEPEHELGKQQCLGLQTGLAWEAGTSYPEGTALFRLPGRLVRSLACTPLYAEPCACLRCSATLFAAEPCACVKSIHIFTKCAHRRYEFNDSDLFLACHNISIMYCFYAAGGM